MKNQINNKSSRMTTVHNNSPSGIIVQFDDDDESRDDLFISNTSDNIRSCYMLNLGFSLVDDDFAFTNATNVRDISKIELNDDEDNNDNDNNNNNNKNPLKVTIQTAGILNGIIVGKHGTLSRQNNRADPERDCSCCKDFKYYGCNCAASNGGSCTCDSEDDVPAVAAPPNNANSHQQQQRYPSAGSGRGSHSHSHGGGRGGGGGGGGVVGRRKVPCRFYFSRAQGCRFGDSCTFDHTKTKGRRFDSIPQQRKNLDMQRRTYSTSRQYNIR